MSENKFFILYPIKEETWFIVFSDAKSEDFYDLGL